MPLLTLFAAATGGGSAPAGWSPNDVTLDSTMVFEVVDIASDLYTSVEGATLATADGDPVGRLPTLRGATITEKAYPSLVPYSSNMTYAPTLQTTDPTHNRVLRFPGDNFAALALAGSLDSKYAVLATTALYAHRFKTGAAGGGGTLPLWSRNPNGPGITMSNASPNRFSVAHDPYGAEIVTAFTIPANTWVTVVVVADQVNGTTVYINDPDTPVATFPSLKPTVADSRVHPFVNIYAGSLFLARRSIHANNIDLAETPVAGVMAWLEANV